MVRGSDGEQFWYAGVLPEATGPLAKSDATKSLIRVNNQGNSFQPFLVNDELRHQHPAALDISIAFAHERSQGKGAVPRVLVDAFESGDNKPRMASRSVVTKEGDAFAIDDWPETSDLEKLVRQQVADVIDGRTTRARGKKPAAKKTGRK
jgi:hypothetical protein